MLVSVQIIYTHWSRLLNFLDCFEDLYEIGKEPYIDINFFQIVLVLERNEYRKKNFVTFFYDHSD